MSIKKTSILCIIVLHLISMMPLCFADVRDYEGVGHYVMSDFETPDVAKQRAKSRAEQSAIEQAGVYVRSYTKTLNAQIVEDEIVTIAGGIIKIKETKYHMEPLSDEGGSFQITATVIATINTDEVQKWLNRDSKDKEILIAQNRKLQELNAEQESKIAYLQKQLTSISSQQDKKDIQEKFKAVDNEFLALEKIKNADRALTIFEYDKAVLYCNEALILNPSNALAYEIIGTCYYEKHQYDIAIKNLTEAITLNNNNSNTYNKRGVSYQALSKHEEALSDFNIAIRLSPQNEKIYNNRAMTYASLGRIQLAMADYSKAIELNPHYTLAYYNRAETYLHEKQYALAITDFSKAISLNPYDADAYNDRAIAYNAEKNYLLAINDCTKSIELNPKNPNPYFNRGEAYWGQGKYELAANDYLKTLEINPYDVEAHEKLGVCFRNLGYVKEAEMCFAIANKIKSSRR